MVHEIEDFHGVYLLYCQNPRFKGRTYIGYTVDPNRRIKQHNTGSHAGGAWRTSGRGPWEMVLIIHGFPNMISALRFEWAWQHPDKCRRLRQVSVAKRRSESAFEHRWRMVCQMLHTAPWKRLGLTVRWLKQDFKLDFPADLAPPLHMPVVFGPVCSKKIHTGKDSSPCKPTNAPSATTTEAESRVGDFQDSIIPTVTKKTPFCAVCHKKMKADDTRMTCLFPDCTVVSHMTCLASHFLQSETDGSGHVIPVEGKCPGCGLQVLWSSLVRHYKGCYQDLTLSATQTHTSPQKGGHWADEMFS